MTKLELWAKGIIAREAYFAPGENPKYPNGTLAWRNKNPGNLIFGPLAQKYGATTFYHHPITGHDFAIFPTYEQGFQAMVEILRNAATGKSLIYKPDWTLIQFFTKYSPIRNSKGQVIPNVGYAESVAKIIGVPATTQIKDLVEASDTAPSPNDDSSPIPEATSDYIAYSQRDPRWKDIKLGFGKTTIGSHGCFLDNLAMIVKIPPDKVNEILKNDGGFSGDLIVSDKAAKILGLQLLKGNSNIPGKMTDINYMPDWSPSIKEVDMSPAPGKQQHFVLRVIKDGKRSIIDPWDGKEKTINHYPFVSYRLFKK